ncbi:MAG TPA: CheR family methyltransferase [Gammaproteobacteria bacterium]|nr:CheR family methyltransferase [Gammaproteobacteria bacterium]
MTRPTVVGIGASAGGVEALREFFRALPGDTGAAFVVVVHLPPDRESKLAAILGQCTGMRIVEMADEDPHELEPNVVYVVTPDRTLEIDDTQLKATPDAQHRNRRAPIDLFFRSLAVKHGDGFAVILSGSGTDGAVGAKAVKEAGGLVLVQDPQDAGHEGMPRAVIASGIADVVASVPELATRLVDLLEHRPRLTPTIAREPGQTATADEVEAVLKRIFDLIRARTGHDFSRYKRTTIVRRTARRMQLQHCEHIDQYLRYLQEHPEEVQALFDDLLISVTTFFRDPEAWEALRVNVVLPLLDHVEHNQPIRVWVPACATGEEAYSLAILFNEEITRRNVLCDLVIFASDVDESALAAAREGVYPAAIAADVSEARLARYFRNEGDHYRVSSEIRDCIVFATHSVLRDPPFSKLHLVSCRNLLIYLDRELQQQLQNVFRYALRDDGYLFIGVSETADSELFMPIDKQHRLFRARKPAAGPPARLPQISVVPQLPETLERTRNRVARSRGSATEVHLGALEELAPPSLLVDEHWNVEHLSENVGRFLLPRGGAPTAAVTELVRAELLGELRTVLHQAFESLQPCLSRFVPVQFNGKARLVGTLVQPRVSTEGHANRAIVFFLDAGEAREAGAPEPVRSDTGFNDALVQTLREKLRLAEQRLEHMRQEHTLAYEDLRAANEELQSLNEEYRSTTEELETSKEELQSVNEELQTVNHELKAKLEEVSRANNDLENFMAATDIPMLFLDRNLCIKRYTPPLLQIFNVKAHDNGRPIGDLTHTLVYDELEKDARQVLSDLVPIERAVVSRSGHRLTVRIRPYRTAEDKIDGVVVTFVN